MSTILQRSFAGGELAPSVHSRADMAKYQYGLRTCRNFMVMRHGGVTNRPGTKFLGEKEFIAGNDNIRLEPFTYIAAGGVQSKFILEFGQQYLRVWQDDAHVADPGGAKTITAATRANPVKITSTGHLLSNNNIVTISGVVGMPELNGRDFKITNVAANTFDLLDLRGNNIDGSAYPNPYVSGGTATEVYTQAMAGMTSARLPDMQMYQNGNSMYIVHPDFAPKELICTGANSWTVGTLSIGSSTTAPTSVAVVGPNPLKLISAATQANPVEITTRTAHGLLNGSLVSISGVVGMTELNGNDYLVSNVGAGTFDLQDTDGVDVDGTGYTVYSSGGIINAPGDASYVVTAIDSTTLEESAVSSSVSIGQPDSGELSRRVADSVTMGAAGQMGTSVEVGAKLTITSDGNESGLTFTLSGYGTDGAYTTGSTAGPNATTITSAGTWWIITNVNISGGTTNGTVDIGKSGDANLVVDSLGAGASGDLNENAAWQAGATTQSGYQELSEYASRVSIQTFADETSVEFTVNGTDINGASISDTVFGSNFGFTATDRFYKTVTSVYSDAATTSSVNIGLGEALLYPSEVSWGVVSGALEYNVYKAVNGVFGLIGVSTSPSFTDDGVTPDFSDPPPVSDDPVSLSNERPSAIAVFQQRLFFANSYNNPTRVNASKVGYLSNFNYRRPLQADDAMEFSIIQREYGVIRHLIDLGKLVIFTQSGELVLTGDAAGAITPLDINPAQQSYFGSSKVRPVSIGGNAIFLQTGQRIVRDLGFQFESDGYRGNDLTVFAAHLFDGFTITDMAYQQTPHSIIWATRSDGTLLGLTYLPEHQIWGWHRHDFLLADDINSIATIQESNEDFLYASIERTMTDATSRKYIERMAARYESEVEDYILADSALTYDGYSGAGKTITLSTGGGWTIDDTITMTASSTFFSAADIGKELHVFEADGTKLELSILAFVSGTAVTGKPAKTIPSALRGVAIPSTRWALAVDTVGGLWHLEGEDVSVFADGFVESSPNNPDYPTVTVTAGVASLSKHYAKIHVGLPITADIETLNLERSDGESLIDKKKLITKVTFNVEASRGIWVGCKPPSDDTSDPLENLTESKFRESENYDAPIDLATGSVDVNILPEWNFNGRIFVRQVDPIPLSVLGVAPSVVTAFKGHGGG